jgi:hypothetical protein
MESDGLLRFLQESATCTCPVPDASTPCTHIFPSVPMSSTCSLSFRFSHHYWVGNTDKGFCIMQFFPSSLLCPNILLSTLCLKTLSHCPSFNVRPSYTTMSNRHFIKFSVREQWEYERF